MVIGISALGGCGPRGESITLAGSTAFQPFAEELAEVYMQENPGVSINVQGGGSVVGIQSARVGAADIGMADMVTLPPEAKELKSVIVAKDGIAVIVNPVNKINNLTLSEVRDIFSGKIKNWKEIGGKDGLITVISREEGSGTRKSFDQLVLKGTRLCETALFQNSNGTIREAVATDPNAISYLSIGFLSGEIKALKIGGIPPTNKNVVTGRYKISRPIFFLTKAEPKLLAKNFIAFVLSRKGQKIIEENGLIKVK